jgi:hypothetical protein
MHCQYDRKFYVRDITNVRLKCGNSVSNFQYMLQIKILFKK